jgi:hypothetical protein
MSTYAGLVSQPWSDPGQRREVAGWRSRLVYGAVLVVVLAGDLALIADGEQAGAWGFGAAVALLVAASVARMEHWRPWRGVLLLAALAAGALPGVIVLLPRS